MPATVRPYVSTWLWYLFLAGTGLAILACFRALVEEWVLHTLVGAEEKQSQPSDAKHAVADGVTMQQVRAQRNAYRRALAGGLGGADTPRSPPEANHATRKPESVASRLGRAKP